MTIVRRLAARISPAFDLVADALAQLAQPRPVTMTLGPSASDLFRRAAEGARGMGVDLTPDEVATMFVQWLERFAELAADDELEHVLGRIDHALDPKAYPGCPHAGRA